MNRRQMAFAMAYAKTRNAVQSAVEAGYSLTEAKKHSYRLLQSPAVREQVSYFARMIEEEVTLDAAQVVNQLGAIALAQPDGFLRPDPTNPERWVGVSPTELTPAQKAAVRRIYVEDIYEGTGANRKWVRQEFSYQLHDKVDALTLLGKHFNVFDDKGPQRPAEEMFKDLPQEALDEAMQMFDRLLDKSNRAAIEDLSDGEVLPDD
jgi:hypothetical protein